MEHPDAERRASRHLANTLRGQIERGAYGPGAKLPSYRELRDAHQIALNTAQAAIRLLAAEGLVDIRPASGAFVRAPGSRSPTVREELEDLQATLRRSQRELTRAESAVSQLLARIAAENEAR